MAVEWDCVVEHNREALKRILAMMVTMVAAGAAAVAGEAARPTLPRHLYRAVLAILHPAESAARRLIVVAARGLSLPKPRLKPCVPKPRRRPSPTVIVFPHAARFAPAAAPARPGPHPAADVRHAAAAGAAAAQRPGPLRAAHRGAGPHRPPPPAGEADAVRSDRRHPAESAPRNARRRARRPAERGAALRPLARPQRRAARRPREARAAAADQRPPAGPPTGRPTGRPGGHPASRPTGRPGGQPDVRPILRVGRLSPLRPGRAPGSRRRDRREVHQILANLQYFALEVLEPDTS